MSKKKSTSRENAYAWQAVAEDVWNYLAGSLTDSRLTA
jgi:hypothetical protein